MAAYSLSGKAVFDLDGIYEYTILNFGLEQTLGREENGGGYSSSNSEARTSRAPCTTRTIITSVSVQR